jgi:trehalose 6-phosphate synthase/phosphatase
MSEPPPVMSAESPAFRGKSVLDSPRSNRSLPPVTPGIGPDGKSAYAEERERLERGQQDDDDADDYFAGQSVPHQTARRNSLRRQSLISQTGAATEADPRQAHPNLNLSGRIISASFVVPFNISYHDNGEWVSEHDQLQ